MATIMHPSVAYTQLFGVVAGGAAGDAFRARRHLIDHMQDDVRRARRELGSLGKDRIDTYISAFETLGATSQKLVAARDRVTKTPGPSGIIFSTAVTMWNLPDSSATHLPLIL